MQQLPAFLLLCLMMTLTPGLDTAVVIRNSLANGPLSGVFTALGSASGLFVHAVVVAFGLSALLLSSQLAFEFVKYLGAALLILFGITSLRAALTRRAATEDIDVKPKKTATQRNAFLQGVLTNLTNPKATLFFLAALPQFVDATIESRGKILLTALMLAVIAATFSLVGLSCFGIVAGRARHLLSSARAQRIQHGTLGILLIALGLRVAFDKA